MRSIFSFLIVSVFAAGSLMAQKSPKESAQVLVGVHVQVSANNSSAATSYRLTYASSPIAVLWDEWLPVPQDSSATPVQSPNVIESITPGMIYYITLSSGSVFSYDIQFNAPPGYTVYVGLPNMPFVPSISLGSPNYGGGLGNFSINFYVVPSDGAAWLSPGYARAPHVSDVVWAVSVGQLACGASAGALRWQSQNLSTALLDSTSLNYAAPFTAINAASASYIYNGPQSGSTPVYYNAVGTPDQIAVYYDSSGFLRYIGTNQVQVYIARNQGPNSGYTAGGQNGGYTIQVYGAGIPFQWAGNDPDNAWTFNGGVVDQYTISDPDLGTEQNGIWAGRIQISRLDNQSGTTENWILATSGLSTTITQTDSLRLITMVSTPISGGRTESVKVADNSGNVALQQLRTYQNFPWGEELVSNVSDPGGLALTTTYTYYNTTPGDGHYSKLQSVTNPDGSWVLYNYFDDFAHWGELASVSSPWQDSPSAYSSATSSNCKVVTYNYSPQVYDSYLCSTPVTSVFQTLDAGTQTTINGTVAAQTTISSSVYPSGIYTSFNFFNEPMRTDTIQNYSASGVVQTTTKTVFHNTSDPVYNGKLFSQVNPDGTKISASYWKGTCYAYLTGPSWNATYFAPSSTAATWVSNYLIGTATKQDPTAVLYSTDGVTGGMAIDPVWMTPYKSYRRHTVTDICGNPNYDVTEVFTGSGFEIISWHITNYTWDGLLVTDQDSSGSRSVYTHIDGQVNYKTGPDGIQTQYFFDALMRVIHSEQKGVPATSSYPAQGAIETYYTYDAAGHVLTTTTEPSGGGATLTTASTYGLSGLLLSQTDNTGLTTSYSYSNGARTVSETLPSGSTQVTDKHLDGAPKSVIGNAVVNQFASSAVNGDGTVTTTTYLGSSGSPRWSTTQTDWLGRTISQTHPSFGGGTFVKQSMYNASGQLIETTQTGMSPTLYQYDGLGKLQYTALDVNNNGQIDLGGTDRITETRSQVYEDSNNIWWYRTQTSVFNAANSSTPVLKSDVRKKLVPYASTEQDYINGVKITETDSYDLYGNLTTEVVNSSEASAVVTDTTTQPNSVTPKVKATYNGLLQSSQTAQTTVTTYQYDALGRQTSAVDLRKGTSYTTYFASGTGQTGQVSSQTDAAGNTTSYAYDQTDGRLLSSTDPLGNTTYHAYDHVGHEIKTWGNAAFPVEYAFDVYGSQIAMRTFRDTTINFSGTSWPLSDDGNDPQNPTPSSWTSGDTTTWTFDGGTGLLTSKTDASGQSVGYTYNQNGKLATRTWARGLVTTYSYDPNTADQTGISYSDTTPGLTYTYNRLGQSVSVAQTYGGFTVTTNLQRDADGKLTQEAFDATYFGGQQVTWPLDTTDTGTLGRTIGVQLGTNSNPSSEEDVSYGYDTFGRLISVGLSGGPNFTYGFTNYSNLIGSIQENSQNNWTQTRTWDPNRDLVDSIQTSVSGVTEGDFVYTYDQAGRRNSKVSTGAIFARYPVGGLADAY